MSTEKLVQITSSYADSAIAPSVLVAMSIFCMKENKTKQKKRYKAIVRLTFKKEWKWKKSVFGLRKLRKMNEERWNQYLHAYFLLVFFLFFRTHSSFSLQCENVFQYNDAAVILMKQRHIIHVVRDHSTMYSFPKAIARFKTFQFQINECKFNEKEETKMQVRDMCGCISIRVSCFAIELNNKWTH